MFCPSCGSESTGLKYCNRCGANLTGGLSAPAELISVNLNKAIATIGTTMAVITIGGFIAILVGAVKLAERTSIGTDPIIALIVMGMLTLLTTDIFLGRQLSKLINAALTSPSAPQQSRSSLPLSPETSQVQSPMTARLAAAPSVTENTTRFFESASGPRETEEPLPAKRLKQ